MLTAVEPTVSATTVRAIAAYSVARGIPIQFRLEDRRYPFAEVEDLWSRAAASARDPLMGRRAAALVPFGAFGVVEHLMLLSGTLDDALRRLIHYYPLVNQAFTLTIRKKRDALLLQLQGYDHRPILPAYADFVLASIARRIHLATGDADVAKIRRQTSTLIIDPCCARMPLPCGDEELCEALEMVGQRRFDSPAAMTDLVADAIASRLSRGQPSLAAIARHLGTSERTLQRRLIEEGTHFRDVLDSTRRRIALRLLEEHEPTKNIADRLGFAEARSFHRAFRRWTSTTPGNFRR
jgi:AraC-like DNA-binding protein